MLAWDVAALSRADKLKPRQDYLEELRAAYRPGPKRSILAKLRDAVGRGAQMTITKIERS